MCIISALLKQGKVTSDVFHVAGFYPHDSQLLHKYNSDSEPSDCRSELICVSVL